MSNKIIDNNSSSLIEQMREGRYVATSAFTTFTQLKELHNSHVFCFYEGKDDKLYYDRKIEDNINSNKYYTIIAEGKKNVMQALKLISADSCYDNVSKMFFIDSDFDNHQEINKNLYQTPCYSIENFYVEKDSFIKILKTIFYLNESDLDFKNCMKLYHRRFKEFHKIMLAYNSRLKYIRECYNDNSTFEKYNCSFNDSINNLVNICLNKIQKKPDFWSKIKEIDIKLRPNRKKLYKLRRMLKKSNKFKCFHGKSELSFFKFFLNCLCKEYNNNKGNSIIFSEKRYKISFAPYNNPLLILSQFAYTPSELIKFIKAHRLNTSLNNN